MSRKTADPTPVWHENVITLERVLRVADGHARYRQVEGDYPGCKLCGHVPDAQPETKASAPDAV